MRFSTRIRGFLLIEILMVLAISALLCNMAVYSFRSVLEKVRNDNVLETVLAAIQFARQEALLRYTEIGVCRSDDQKTCSVNALNALLVFMPLAEEENPLEERQVLQIFRWTYQKRGQLYWRAFPAASRHLCFLPNGMTKEQNGSFWYCPVGKSSPAWAVMVSKSGHWRVVYPGRSGGIMDERGVFLDCP